MRNLLILLPLLSVLFSTDYSSDIQPIFDSNCVSCHGNSATRVRILLSVSSGTSIWNGRIMY